MDAYRQVLYPGSPNTVRGMHTVIDVRQQAIVYPSGMLALLRKIEDKVEPICFSQHKQRVMCTRFNKEGTMVASGDCQGMVYIWNLQGQKKKQFALGFEEINDIEWNKQSIIVVGKASTTFAIHIDLQKDKATALGGLSKTAFGVGSYQNVVAIGGQQQQVKFYKNNKFFKSDKSHKGLITCIRASNRGEFASTGYDKTIKFFDLEGSLTAEIRQAHEGSIMQLVWKDQSTLISSSNDKTIKIWQDKKLLHTLSVSQKPSLQDFQVGIGYSQPNIISVSLNGQINFFKDYSLQRVVQGHQSSVISILGLGDQIVSADQSGKIVAWKRGLTGSGRMIGQFKSKEMLSGLLLANDKLVAVSLSGTMRWFHPTSFKLEKVQQLKIFNSAVAYSSQLGFALAKENSLCVIKQAKEIKLDSQISALSDGLDGSFLVGLNSGQLVEIKKQTKRQLRICSYKISAIAVDPHARTKAVGDSNGTIFLLDSDLNEIHRKFSHSGMVTAICFAQLKLVTTSLDKKLSIWNLSQNKLERKIDQIHKKGGRCLSIVEGEVWSGGWDNLLKQHIRIL